MGRDSLYYPYPDDLGFERPCQNYFFKLAILGEIETLREYIFDNNGYSVWKIFALDSLRMFGDEPNPEWYIGTFYCQDDQNITELERCQALQIISLIAFEFDKNNTAHLNGWSQFYDGLSGFKNPVYGVKEFFENILKLPDTYPEYAYEDARDFLKYGF